MPVPKGARIDPAETQTRLLDSAERLFADRAMHSVGVNEIAAEAGASKLSLYRYFPSRLNSPREWSPDAATTSTSGSAGRPRTPSRDRVGFSRSSTCSSTGSRSPATADAPCSTRSPTCAATMSHRCARLRAPTSTATVTCSALASWMPESRICRALTASPDSCSSSSRERRP
ncbi:helix-turn-helix transcriptional regulator [Microbacterium sp. Se63.02b]|nr:helix-turn-helix transcriptional regulator [Microbacterium sp. Se63.02b]